MAWTFGGWLSTGASVGGAALAIEGTRSRARATKERTTRIGKASVSDKVTQPRFRAKKAARFGPMTGPEFEAALRKLVSGATRTSANVACVGCERCERCSECTFCVGSKGLARCHYCDACSDCTDCAHCARSTGCLACQHCVESDRCIGCAYLVRSVGCSGCTYCFGCVGLSRRDFHILNEPYDRATYFETTARLARELRLALP